jgi:hypothetical protein
MTEQRRVSYFYDAEVGNYHYGQGTVRHGSPTCRTQQISVEWINLTNASPFFPL